MKKRATVITYGCQMNVNESAKMKQMLQTIGYEIIEDITKSDLVFLNTCTVREGAASRVYSKLSNLKHLKEKKKGKMIIGVTGCLAQEVRDDFIKKTPYVDLVLGNQNIGRIPDLIERVEKGGETHIVEVDDEDELPERIDADFGDDIVASISITYGCNNYCTFCIVPYVRGMERSVPVHEVLKDVKQYTEKGYKEILFLGQNVNSYGSDLADKKDNFARLLNESANIEGDFWIKYVSPHPKDFTDEVIDAIANNSKVAKMLHLPLQSGSTKILNSMNRGYTKEEFVNLTKKIKNKIPDIGLTTDIIVGFPGETDDDFQDTLDVVNEVGFENAFMFMYSVRSGTPAATMDEQVSEQVKSERLQQLMRLQNMKAKEETKKYLDQTIKVLVEGPSKKNPEMLTGRTSTHKIALFKSDRTDLKGKFVNIRVYDTKTWTLYGEMVE
ncbi:MAG: tRNA (N6-isopentenyl adenosine(37)-C2)-methylthiotransferase MiaB [Leptotrichiaceae bacterium]|nr:tRNA (N6-isopentenyl adenosine(37)-C2)-methylthiotransferase MiaB [Leptotrichiaceae bacterium]MBP6280620.1 tRNA (N6-isopentenyl adenosine(37)-C2)-methylthiotransferase MiaB [Leptotrichiaceae bacterium]MBP7100113.1 tRNA (N6-isopentenyl adenosine(37)-C2)-methylthiotransferase MiaB [Leptotrichiaceae bacterium]MBP7725119.1 tRNA (N6-isopentenyl adenosine(37)-C2)-methylthiotransferase MiaB [Leptotrichiaceae bacterium]MBP9629198.1 tRNA (N6-isopentenyl adenosine(37)-C2)-methylthiotransferase MiaB [L